MPEAYIIDVLRTPSGRGKAGGALSGVHPAALLADLLAALVARNGVDPVLIDDVIAGCVAQVGEQALNIGRSAVLGAGFPESVPATTIDRQCGSSQQAAHFAAQGTLAGAYDLVIACGVESMSRIPMGSSNRGADAFGPRVATRYPDGVVNQGISAELLAAKYKLDRVALDEYSARSHSRAAASSGFFSDEIEPVHLVDETGDRTVSVDETVRATTTVEGLGSLSPSFADPALAARFPQIDWKITAGNSSPLTDGASAILIASEAAVADHGLAPRARFHGFAVVGSDPVYMLDGPVPATQKVLQRSGLTLEDIDAYEVNEAFAPVPLLWQHELNADPEKLNPRGGAIALGHALGASGTRLLTTLVHHLEVTGGRYGLQTMCEGAGMANATVIERL
jgi:acetyl-CoA acyltransferase